MALDTSIPLEVKQPQQSPLAMVGQYAQAASALQNVQNAKAALPGIQADSAIKQRAAAFNKWMTDNATQYVRAPSGDQKDANGNPITGPTDANGKPVPTLDHAAFINAAANAGFVTEAQSVMANDLKNQSTALSNGLTQANIANTQAGTNGIVQDNANKAQGLALSGLGYTSTLMDAYEKANPNAPPQQYDAEYNKLIGMQKAMYGKALDVEGLYGKPTVVQTDQNGNAVMGPDGKPSMTYKYDSVLNKAVRTATMSPEVQQGLANQREALDQSGASGQSSVAYRNINSNETKAAQNIAIATDPAHTDIYRTMTGAQLAANATVGGAVKANIVPADVHGTAAVNMAQQLRDTIAYHSAADAMDNFARKLQNTRPQDLPEYNASPINFFQNRAAQFAGDPDFLTAQTLLGNVNQTHAELKLSGMGAAALTPALRAQGMNSLRQAGTSGAIASSGTFTEAAANLANQGGQQNATATKPQGGPAPTPATGTVRVKGPDGRTGTIPASQLAAAKAKGYTEVK